MPAQQLTPAQAMEKMIFAERKKIDTLLPRHITPERFMRIIFTQFHKNAMLAKCTNDSVLASVLVAAEMGLIPDGRNGAMVPFKNKQGKLEAQFIPMYQGLIELARQSGQIADIFPATVCENDEFTYDLGLHKDLYHRPAFKNRGKPIAYYGVVEFKDGTKTFGPGPMTLDDIDGIRRRSKASSNGPWVTDFEAMAWKTVIRRVLKFCPKSPELNDALIISDDYESKSQSSTSSYNGGNTFEHEPSGSSDNVETLNAEIKQQASKAKQTTAKDKQEQQERDEFVSEMDTAAATAASETA
jgi:recombination protein RecT